MSATLLLSHRDSEDRRGILAAAQFRPDISTVVLDGYRVALGLSDRESLRIYAEPMFADVVASQLDLALLEAPPDWLTAVPEDLLGRRVQQSNIAAARKMSFPRFVKAIDDKRIPPRVYTRAADIPGPDIVDDFAVVLTSEPIIMRTEVRLFVLDNEIQAGSMYLHEGKFHPVELSLLPARHEISSFVRHALRRLDGTLPRATVLDVALTADDHWVIVEANAAWGAGLYACNPAGALQAALAASTDKPPTATEIPFVRERVEAVFD